MNDTKPTAAAIRAELAVSDAIASNPKIGFRERACIIDRETGLPELLEACKQALPFVQDHVCRTLDEGPGDRIAFDMLEAAIAKAEGSKP